ncbi:recombinase RecT [Yoonia sp.]|uniref:recombinase RecT n=1 Tax=Yoonia sp. TaxID=2212373 RepID=UPI002E008E10|nr:recombinase RecT [Yoonia sp.]
MNQALAKTPLTQVSNVKHLLVNDNAKAQLAAVAARHMNPERLMRVTANAIRTTPKLQECDPISFLGALMQCAALGLEPNTVMGFAYMIPFKNNKKGITEVQLIVGYRGLIDLARRSGHITTISAHIHYSDDIEWVYQEGSDPKLVHVPGDQEGQPLHAYAVAQFRDGGFAQIVLPWKQVMKIRDGSQGWQTAVKFGSTKNSPWFTHEAAMAKKTAIRALAKYLPLSVEFQDAIQIDKDGGAQVDYAGFALNPDQGGPIIEGEAVDSDEDVPEPEQERKAEPVKQQAKPAHKAETKPRDAVSYTEAEEVTQEQAKPAQKAAGAEPAPAATTEAEAVASFEKHNKTFNRIMDELLSGAMVDDVRANFAADLAAMEQAEPKLREKIEAELAEFKAQEG